MTKEVKNTKKTVKTVKKLNIRQFLYRYNVKNEFLIKTLERTWGQSTKYIKEWKEIDNINKLIE